MILIYLQKHLIKILILSFMTLTFVFLYENINAFLTKNIITSPMFIKYKLFNEGRFPGVIYLGDNSVLFIWGAKKINAALSEDGGMTISRKIAVDKAAINGGGALYDKESKKIHLFGQNKHPPADLYQYVSSDKGKNFIKKPLNLIENIDNKVQLHFSGNGSRLLSNKCSGNLIRPTRVYGIKDGYNNAIYSSDGGLTWKISKKFPILSTGEGAITELSNGNLIYSSRRHWFKSNNKNNRFRVFAISKDCGRSWENEFISSLPDGPMFRDINKPMGPTFQGHYGLMGDLISLNYKGSNILLHSMVYRKDHLRKDLRIFYSIDNGISWKKTTSIHPGPSAYSTLALVGNPRDTKLSDKIVIHFEGGEDKEYQGSYVAIVNLKWIFENFEQ